MDNQIPQLQEALVASRAVLGTYEVERAKMLALLQDHLTQYLSAIKMNLLALEPCIPLEQNEPIQLLGKIKGLIDESFIGIKRVTRFENARTPLNIGFYAALNLFLRQIDQRILKINSFIDYPQNAFDQYSEMLIFRIIQELINNAILHSGANYLDITVQSDKEAVSVIVEDDGCGFEQFNDKTKGRGIDIILCRMVYLKGTIEWSTSKQGGTIVAFHLPLH
jgi:signal transduction histidine kinase